MVFLSVKYVIGTDIINVGYLTQGLGLNYFSGKMSTITMKLTSDSAWSLIARLR